VPFWSKILARTLPMGVLEVGCNAGWNLMAIRSCWGGQVLMKGVDINEGAVAFAERAGFLASVGGFENLWAKYQPFDLVFTSGVLIHVAPQNLNDAMAKLAAASRRYVLAIEYEHDREEEIVYRGERERLWKRPFGSLYEELGLKLVEYWPNVEGWDRCAAWLMEK
jgi:SAM-dependent methyltransferase